MAAHDYYRTLGVTPEASSDDIKKAYRQLAVKYHPDRNFGDSECEEQLKAINEAYQVLGDERRRQLYDFFCSQNPEHKVDDESMNAFRTQLNRNVNMHMRGACRGMGLGGMGCRRRMWNFNRNR